MFEIIGLIFATGMLFVLSALVGGVYGFVAWLALRKQHGYRKLWVYVGPLVPPACAAYMVLCAFFFAFFIPGATDNLFGDIHEPLPNGYVLTGLAKMPDFSGIEAPANPRMQPQLLGCIGGLDVDGPFVYGAYSHKYGSFSEPVEGDAKYFAFDTRTGQVLNLVALPVTGASSGATLHLSEPLLFRSHERSHRIRVQIENSFYFGPPILASILYFGILLRLRRHPPRPALQSN